MSESKEMRFLQVEVPEPTSGTRTTEVRAVKVRVLFSDGSWTDLTTHTSMKPWPSGDLLETVKNFVAELERS